ncbi:MAG: OadG family protein [Congregibacter sp.]|nr:OadG family protein [Congregibacter sp.]
MHANLFSQGLELLVYGMGTVVLFLTLLVFATRLMSLLVQRFFPDAPPVSRQQAHSRESAGLSAPILPSSPSPSPELLAAIAAAVHQHRQWGSVSRVSDLDQRKAHV